MAEGLALDFEDAGAELSDCGLYRYTLWRTWTREPALRLVVCMLNPSTADATVNDATIAKLCGFARRFGFGGIHVVNLFALRSTDPKALKHARDPMGPKNLDRLQHAMQLSKAMQTPFVCAWGAGGSLHSQDRFVLKVLAYERVQPMCLRITKSGAPEHPLYIPYSATLKPYEVPDVRP